jgi:hypothetical protein
VFTDILLQSAEEGGAVGSTGQKVAEKADAKATLEKKF